MPGSRLLSLIIVAERPSRQFALTPGPSPAGGRGERIALTATMGTWCPPSPVYGRGEITSERLFRSRRFRLPRVLLEYQP